MPENLTEKLFIDDFDSLVDNIIGLEGRAFSYDELIPLIRQSENKDIRCWALLKIEQIDLAEDAGYIVETLIENDSRMRELASEVIYKHLMVYDPSYRLLFDRDDYYDAYVKTVTDINPRVTRNITACFMELAGKDLIFEKLVEALKNFKGPFVEYWGLEGISKIVEHLEPGLIQAHSEYLFKVFNKIIISQDDLLKEKVAVNLVYLVKVLDLSGQQTLIKNIDRLKNDRNFFVRQEAEKIILKKEI